MTNFGKVYITNIYNRSENYECKTLTEYKEYLKNNPAMVENIRQNDQQIKPVFYVDAYETDIDINDIKTIINELFPNKPIDYAKREPREYKGKLKYSYRLYVDGVRITSQNLKKLLTDKGFKDNEPFDLSIYDVKKVLFLPLTTDKGKEKKEPSLEPIDCDIFNCCASYIKEDYEDWDAKMPKTESIKEQFKRLSNNILLDEDDDENPNEYNRLTHLIKLLSQKRSEDFNSWINIAWCLINISNKEKITRRKTEDLIHQFSKLSPTNYDENKVDEWISKKFDNVREKSYGWSYIYIYIYIRRPCRRLLHPSAPQSVLAASGVPAPPRHAKLWCGVGASGAATAWVLGRARLMRCKVQRRHLAQDHA